MEPSCLVAEEQASSQQTEAAVAAAHLLQKKKERRRRRPWVQVPSWAKQRQQVEEEAAQHWQQAVEAAEPTLRPPWQVQP